MVDSQYYKSDHNHKNVEAMRGRFSQTLDHKNNNPESHTNEMTMCW